MGGSCRTIQNRETIFAGGSCENKCFKNHGGCNASNDLVAQKQNQTCEYKTEKHDVLLIPIEEINKQIEDFTQKGKSVFLYTPDLFSNIYYDKLFQKMPCRNGNTYIAVNACVNSLVEKQVDFKEIKSKGIFEIWLGVESASKEIRNKYNKPNFTNDDLLRITKQAKEHNINVCWYLVDGKEDTDETKLETFNLIKKGSPYRINIEQLQ
jgi:radical SAM superfamily enzyme